MLFTSCWWSGFLFASLPYCENVTGHWPAYCRASPGLLIKLVHKSADPGLSCLSCFASQAGLQRGADPVLSSAGEHCMQVPYLVPLPGKHTLPVKAPFKFTTSTFGDLRNDNLQLVIEVNE